MLVRDPRPCLPCTVARKLNYVQTGKLTMECITHLKASSALGIDLDPILITQATALALSISPPPQNCSFLHADFMQTPSEFFQPYADKVDLILLLSITKWLHLHHSDVGLVQLFKALFEVLSPGGILIVEPQEWENYKQACKKNKNLKPVFKGLKMRPPFVDEIKECGFEMVKIVERSEGGFSRPLCVWRKTKAAIK